MREGVSTSDEPSDLTPAEFEARLQKLVRARSTSVENPGCLGCDACEKCVDCTFCKNGRSLTRCHYFVDCERCFSSLHCRASRDLVSCNHCEGCERCTASSYLTRCFDCAQCAYCFGCVGLVGKEFCILNEPYSRSDYFAMMKKLARAVQAAR